MEGFRPGADARSRCTSITATGGGTVVVETRVDSAVPRRCRDCHPLAALFDTPALDTARSWTFRPAQSLVAPPSQYAYLVFIFRDRITGAGTAPGPPTPIAHFTK
jgi:hypothetical protein